MVSLSSNVVLSHPVFCHICKSVSQDPGKVFICLFGLPVNFLLSVVCKLGYEDFKTWWRILV